MIKPMILKALDSIGYRVERKPRPRKAPLQVVPKFDKIHYGSGRVYIPDWLNVDIIATGPENYMYADLTNRHPFPDNSFDFAFSEDFIEHIDQGSSLLFLLEVHRTLRHGGVFRLTFPVLDSVLKKHFYGHDFDSYQSAKHDAYDSLGHLHFYSIGSLELVAKHIGFGFEVVEVGKSKYPQFEGLDTRTDGVNIHVELTKNLR